jgi:hypothetical protein
MTLEVIRQGALVDVDSGERVASAFYPKTEMPIQSVKPGWAESRPRRLVEQLQLATADVLKQAPSTEVWWLPSVSPIKCTFGYWSTRITRS